MTTSPVVEITSRKRTLGLLSASVRSDIYCIQKIEKRAQELHHSISKTGMLAAYRPTPAKPVRTPVTRLSGTWIPPLKTSLKTSYRTTRSYALPKPSRELIAAKIQRDTYTPKTYIRPRNSYTVPLTGSHALYIPPKNDSLGTSCTCPTSRLQLLEIRLAGRQPASSSILSRTRTAGLFPARVSRYSLPKPREPKEIIACSKMSREIIAARAPRNVELKSYSKASTERHEVKSVTNFRKLPETSRGVVSMYSPRYNYSFTRLNRELRIARAPIELYNVPSPARGIRSRLTMPSTDSVVSRVSHRLRVSRTTSQL